MGTASVVELTPDNWDKLVVQSGKNVFVKFFAPWCGHCKKMKPDWDKLGEQYDESGNILIGDVDCTGPGKSLCDQNDVKGFPTLKSFWKATSSDYSGSRSYEDLKKYADSMKPLCSPDNLEDCTTEQKVEVEKLLSMKEEELKQKIDEHTKSITTAEKEHEELLKDLQKKFKDSMDSVDALKEKVNPELALLKVVLSGKEHKKDEL